MRFPLATLTMSAHDESLRGMCQGGGTLWDGDQGDCWLGVWGWRGSPRTSRHLISGDARLLCRLPKLAPDDYSAPSTTGRERGGEQSLSLVARQREF
jgi:hypothetical protein